MPARDIWREVMLVKTLAKHPLLVLTVFQEPSAILDFSSGGNMQLRN
jgi:hypothetical protein